jgi:hypothetical protein
MTTPDRLAALTRLSPAAADDLDPLLAPFDPRAAAEGGVIAPCLGPVRLPPLPLAGKDAVAIGLDLPAPPADAADLAFRLGALAAEQEVEVVILSGADYSGLERFGFRTERITGATGDERAACRDQICQLWGIELVIPAEPRPGAGRGGG